MNGKSTVFLLIAIALGAPAAIGAECSGGDCLILETSDPPGDQADLLQLSSPHPGGDLWGARLILRKIPIPRGELTQESRPDWVYAPVELTILIDRELTGGEVQLCIFAHLPPLHIEHIISRDSIMLGEPEGNNRVLLATNSEISLFTGMEDSWDAEVIAFQKSDRYRNCYFEAEPAERGTALNEAARFNIHSGVVYRFPPSPSFYWTKIPPLSVSTYLEVRKLNNLVVGPVSSTVNDTLKSSWREVTGSDPAPANF